MSGHPAIPAKRVPGEEGIWVFIFGDLVVFGLFFVTYGVYRSYQPDLYDGAQALLNRNLGLLNTVLLLTSSLFVAIALKDARGGGRHAPRLLGCAILCGLGFVSVKAIEYSEKIQAGITLNTNEFFTFYYMYTGIHLMHVVLGIGVLTFLALRLRGQGAAGNLSTLEGGCAFWHLVDLLWVMLFPLLYLVK